MTYTNETLYQVLFRMTSIVFHFLLTNTTSFSNRPMCYEWSRSCNSFAVKMTYFLKCFANNVILVCYGLIFFMKFWCQSTSPISQFKCNLQLCY